MANAVYPKYKEYVQSVVLGAGATVPAGVVKAALVKGTYTYSDAHDFLDDLGTDVIVSTGALVNKTFVNGVFKNSAGSTFTAAPTGNTGTAVVLYLDTGTASTSRLVAYLDTLTNLPIVCNGGDVNVTWDSGVNGIFGL